MLSRSAAIYPGRMAFRAPWGDGALESITFSELGRRAVGAAEELAADVDVGDFVLIGGRNSLPWVVGFFGVLVRGGIPVPVDTEMPEAALSSIVDELNPAAVIGDEDFLARVSERDTRRISFTDVHEWPESSGAIVREPKPDPDGLALLLYTGGTTGRPKGVMLSHRNLIAAVESGIATAELREPDVLFVVLPLFHVFPLTTGCIAPIVAGVPAELEYRLLHVAQRAAETPPTIFLGVPSLFEALLRQIRRNAQGGIRGAYFSAASWFNALLIRTVGVNLGRVLFRPVQKALGGRLRFMVSGGSRLDPEVHRGMMAIGLPVIQGYGLSEAAAVVSAQRFNHGEFWWRARGYWRNVGSVGPAAEGVTVSISPHESSKGHGEGELTVQGPNVMMGYYQRPDDTKLMIQDGLLQTGDIARIDNDGSIWITGRASLVISMPNGKLVNLETFEAQLSQATEIGQVRLTIEQEPKWQLIATVFPSIDALVDGNIENNNDLHRLMREVVRRQSLSLPSWLRVDEVRLVDETLPVTRLGKLRRVELPDHSFDFDHWSAAALELSQS